jgi:hypothetical protein
MESKLLNIDLPKWSRMVVVGDNISQEQAAEIIIRTTDLDFSTNDSVWRRQLHNELGLIPEKDSTNSWYFIDSNKSQEVRKSLGILNLEYLQNHQIASSYIGGPHGWCSWDGTIGCGDYNIGKYPSVKRVFEEWKLIASTWPFLKLRCQLWSDEEESNYNNDSDSYSDNIKESRPLIEYIIENGTVSLIKPKRKLNFNGISRSLVSVFLPHGERGCSFSQFQNAIQIVSKNISQMSNESH